MAPTIASGAEWSWAAAPLALGRADGEAMAADTPTQAAAGREGSRVWRGTGGWATNKVRKGGGGRCVDPLLRLAERRLRLLLHGSQQHTLLKGQGP